MTMRDSNPETLTETLRLADAKARQLALVRLGDTAALWFGAALLPWSFSGYGAPIERPRDEVELLTPPATVAVLAAGYRPLVHPTAEADARGPSRTARAS